jgi:hypothetical protein
MSTTRDWLHGGEDWNRPPERRGIGGVILWVMGLVAVALGALAMQALRG